MKTITESERMSVIGLLTVGHDLQAQLDTVVRALKKVTNEGPDLSCCEDALYGYPSRDKAKDADQLLSNLLITVVPDEAAE